MHTRRVNILRPLSLLALLMTLPGYGVRASRTCAAARSRWILLNTSPRRAIAAPARSTSTLPTSAGERSTARKTPAVLARLASTARVPIV